MKCSWIAILVLMISACTTTSESGSSGPGAVSSPEPGVEAAKVDEAAAVASTQVKEQEKEKLVCYREKAVGSHFSKKVCKTRSQMDAERRAAKDLQDRSSAHDDSQLGGGQ